MRMKQGIIGLAAAVMAVGSYADPIHISVTGTADNTNMGYTSGQSYTFTWTINDGYTGGSYDSFTSSQNFWNSGLTSDPQLWTSVSGDGLSGTYSRPSGTFDAVADLIYAGSGGMDLLAGNRDPTGSSNGLTVNGTEVYHIYANRLNVPGLDYSDTTFVNPADWLSDYTGTHALSRGYMNVRDKSGNQIDFTPTSATIIPEPSTIAFVGLFGGGLLFIRRYFLI